MTRSPMACVAMSLMLVGCSNDSSTTSKTETPKSAVAQGSPASAPAEKPSEKQAERPAVELHPTLVHDPVPEGYSVATQDIVVGGKVLGQMIEVTRPGEKSKVGIQIQTGVATTAGPRRAAAKGYVNGFAGALAKAGYKVTNSKLPDITKEEFKKPITVEMNFAKDSGEQLHARLLIFFTDNGYSVQVLGDSEDTLNALHTWAKTIRAK